MAKDYFNDPENVKKYIQMVEDYDGGDMVSILRKHLPEGSSLLELGMGPGKDLDLLSEYYRTSGSDSSQLFLDIYLKKNPGADIMKLDATLINTTRRFDCLYSNKVLHLLSKEDLISSVKRQWHVLNDNGILFHTFWKGNKEIFINDLRFVYYTSKYLRNLFQGHFEIITIQSYGETDEKDSLYLICQKKC